MIHAVLLLGVRPLRTGEPIEVSSRESRGGRAADTMVRLERMAANVTEGYLDGQMLLAMPGVTDKTFARSIVLVCAHSSSGAMGIVVNRRAENIDFQALLVQLKVISPDEAGSIPIGLAETPVMVGGPVESNRGFVLHSADCVIRSSTVPIVEQICLTPTVEILTAMARGKGPRDALLAIGYVAWSGGQLETEIQANQWLNCSADRELIFRGDPTSKYDHAFRKLGIDLGMLSGELGHA